jgi:hypothetical protein
MKLFTGLSIVVGCIKTWLLLVIIVVPITSASAATYYINNNGNDSNNGTSTSSPWKTIDKINNWTFLPGDQILFQGGQTFYGNVTIDESGSSGNLIKISSYGEGKASIDAGAGSGIFIYNQGMVWVDSLVLYGVWNSSNQSGNSGYGVQFYTDTDNGFKYNDVFVSYCDISGFKNSGINFSSWAGDNSQSGYNNVKIWGNTVHDNGDAGISSFGYYPTAPGSTAYAHTGVYVGWNTTYNNLGVVNKGNNSGSGIVLGDVDGAIIENNVAYNNGWKSNYSGGGPVGIWCWDANNVTIQYNESHHNGTGSGTPDGGGFDLDGAVTNSVLQYNYSHENWGAGYLLYEFGAQRVNNKNNIVRYNISQNDGGNPDFSGLYVGGNCTNNNLYNNSIFTNQGSPVYVGGGSSNNFINNIFYATSSSNYALRIQTENCSFLSNNYYFGNNGFQIAYNGTTYNSLSNFRSGTNQEIFNSVNYGYNVNPSLINAGNGGNINSGDPSSLDDYKLNSVSSMIDAGYNISTWWSTGSRDFNGITIPYDGGDYDIGACEFEGDAPLITSVWESAHEVNTKLSLQEEHTVAYPNPFGVEVLIPVTLEKPSDVHLEILNITGQRVRYISLGELASGYQLLHWDGLDQNQQSIHAGSYVYKILINGVVTRGKLIKR